MAQSTKWRAGVSGNPSGRPRGVGKLAKLRAAIETDLPAIINTMATLAKAGDVSAAALLLNRVLAPLKPIEAPIVLSMPADLTGQAGTIMQAVAGGVIAPGQGAQLLAALASFAKTTEILELADRITALETKGNAP